MINKFVIYLESNIDVYLFELAVENFNVENFDKWIEIVVEDFDKQIDIAFSFLRETTINDFRLLTNDFRLLTNDFWRRINNDFFLLRKFLQF